MSRLGALAIVACLASCAAQLTATQPNPTLPDHGVDGELSADVPRDAPGTCRADYAPGGRNPGLVRLVHGRTFSFYEDREGTRPIAEDCTYGYQGFRADPRYFGTGPDQSPTSIWMTYALVSGSMACEARFAFVIVRAPEGEGRLRHMHLRYGSRATSLDALVDLSRGAAGGNPCDPWWSVYCLRGVTGCDPD